MPAFHLDESVLHLGGDGAIARSANDASYWLERDRPELSSGQILSVFAYAATWDYQERHPTGDELAVLLDGSGDLLVDTGEGERPIRLEPNTAVIIPTGAWHRLAVNEPSRLLFITPTPATTQHRPITR